MNANAPPVGGGVGLSPVILGLWPIAGVTTVGVTRQAARDTIATAIDCGIRAFDSAFSYGFDGESDRLIGDFIRADRDAYFLIGKVGQRWDRERRRVVDGRPETLRADAECSLRRIGIDRFDLLMLHAPDPSLPPELPAGAIAELRDRGLCDRVGICNADTAQRRDFARVAGCDAIQCPLNLMQRQSLSQTVPQAAADGCDVHVYWTLMKGLLAGRIAPDHTFPPGDSRPGYAIFQGESRRRAHEIVDGLRKIGGASGMTVAQLSIGWALSQPGVTAALVGGRRPDQIRETAAARPLPADILEKIENLAGPAGTHSGAARPRPLGVDEGAGTSRQQ